MFVERMEVLEYLQKFEFELTYEHISWLYKHWNAKKTGF